MATALEKEEKPNCAICFQLYTEPRQLPGCSHCFCESCIVNFILDLKRDEKLGSEFKCPVCKLPSTSPGVDDSVHRWVTTMEINEDIKAKCVEEKKTQLPDAAKCCSQCLSCEKTVIACKYCLTCQKYYCGSCSKTLHTFVVNQSHTVIDSEEDGFMGRYEDDLQMLNKFVTCSEHPKEFVTFYCEDEKKFCCLACFMDFHKTCKGVKPISTLSEQSSIVKNSANLLGLADKMLKHIDNIMKAVKENNEENKRTAEQLGVKFQEMKQKVINLLDVMESNVNDDGKAAVKNAALKNQDEIDDLECLKQKLKTVPRLLGQVAKFTSVDQAFVCIHEIEHSMEDIEKQIIGKGGVLKTTGLELKTTDTFETIQKLGPNETMQLASVTQQEASIVVPVYKDRPFLRKYKIQKTGAHKILPKENAKENTPTYAGLLFLPENKFLLVDSYYGFLCLVDEGLYASNRWQNFVIRWNPDKPFGNERHATYFENGVIVVSIPSEERILLLSADGHFTDKGEIMCEYQPKAICGMRNGDIAIAWDKPVAFGIISNSTWNPCGRVFSRNGGLQYCEKVYFTKDTSGRQFQSFKYMVVDEKRGHIIQSCSVEKTVFCFDMIGNPVFRYSNALEDPRGMALDNDGNIYICEYALSSIHIVSAEGTAITIIGKDQGCPSSPLAIGYDKMSDVFAVTEDGDDSEWDRVNFFSVRPNENGN